MSIRSSISVEDMVLHNCSTIPTMFGSPPDTGPAVYFGDYQFNPYPGSSVGNSHGQVLAEEAAVHKDSSERQGGPVWSPDFTKIAYSAWTRPGATPIRLMVMNADGSDRTTIDSTFSSGLEPDGYTFSPDGSKIAWIVNGGDRVRIAATDGTGSISEIGPISSYGPPIWSHDGEYIFYVDGNDLWRRKADLSTAGEMVFEATPITYPNRLLTGLFHMHPFEPIIVFDCYEVIDDGSGGGDFAHPDSRVLGFQRVEELGCPAEFIKYSEASWLVGDENNLYPLTPDTPTWSPDGRYIMGRVSVDPSPYGGSQEYRSIIIDREQTFLRLIDVWGHPADATPVPSDGYFMWTSSWKADASGIVCLLNNDWDMGIAEWNFPSGPLQWLYRSTPLSGTFGSDYPEDYVWSRENLSGIPYQVWWQMNSLRI